MPTKIASIVATSRKRLIEDTASFWTDVELADICILGIKDLWRDTVDLKQEHYLTVNTTDVSLPANSSTLIGVPTDVHKVYMVKPVDTTTNSVNVGLTFRPTDLN